MLCGQEPNRSFCYEDEKIILLNKRTGLLSHPDDSEYIDTLITRTKRYLYEKGEWQRVTLEVDFVCNLGSRRYYLQSAYRLPDEESQLALP